VEKNPKPKKQIAIRYFTAVKMKNLGIGCFGKKSK